jgi:methylated-DNA-[protein]-cysteine S-methyltransferase
MRGPAGAPRDGVDARPGAIDAASDAASDPTPDPVLDPASDPAPDPVLDPVLDAASDPALDPAGGAAGAGRGPRRCALFPTAIGACGIAWHDGAVTHVLLPAADATATRSLLQHLSGVRAEPTVATGADAAGGPGGWRGVERGAEAGGAARGGKAAGPGAPTAPPHPAQPAVAAGEAPREPWPAFVEEAVRAMQALLAGEAVSLAGVPLAWERVGEFERRVYEATRRLAPGETTTYGEMARALGDPAAARAVGVALGCNPWPLVVPCHRVLAAGGRLGGFSAPGGVATKERLLAIEARHVRREGELF